MKKKYICKAVFLISFALIFISCKKRPDIDPLLVGSWRYKRANIHFIYSFRANRSFVIQQKMEGKFSRIVEKKAEIEGTWDLEAVDDKIFLLMTATKIKGDDKWIKDELASFEILEITELDLNLKNDKEQITKYSRVRGKQADVDPEAMGYVKVSPGPFVVNLKNDRVHGKFRFLCVDLEFSVEKIDDNDYVSVEILPESEEVKYHLHPKIREVTIFYLSSLTYKDTKSLDKMKKVVTNLKMVLSPYFNGGLKDISVKKVVVTVSSQSVREFEELYAETPLEELPGDGADITPEK